MGRKLRELREILRGGFEYFSTNDWVCCGGQPLQQNLLNLKKFA